MHRPRDQHVDFAAWPEVRLAVPQDAVGRCGVLRECQVEVPWIAVEEKGFEGFGCPGWLIGVLVYEEVDVLFCC